VILATDNDGQSSCGPAGAPGRADPVTVDLCIWRRRWWARPLINFEPQGKGALLIENRRQSGCPPLDSGRAAAAGAALVHGGEDKLAQIPALFKSRRMCGDHQGRYRRRWGFDHARGPRQPGGGAYAGRRSRSLGPQVASAFDALMPLASATSGNDPRASGARAVLRSKGWCRGWAFPLVSCTAWASSLALAGVVENTPIRCLLELEGENGHSHPFWRPPRSGAPPQTAASLAWQQQVVASLGSRPDQWLPDPAAPRRASSSPLWCRRSGPLRPPVPAELVDAFSPPLRLCLFNQLAPTAAPPSGILRACRSNGATRPLGPHFFPLRAACAVNTQTDPAKPPFTPDHAAPACGPAELVAALTA